MKKNTPKKPAPAKEETQADLKQQAVKKDEVKKGYNEKNPVQPQGAFKPDNTSDEN